MQIGTCIKKTNNANIEPVSWDDSNCELKPERNVTQG